MSIERIINIEDYDQLSDLEWHKFIHQVKESLFDLSEGLVLLNAHDIILWSNLQALVLLNIHHEQHKGHHITNILKEQEFIQYLQNPDFFLNGVTILSPEYQNRYIQIKVVQFGERCRLVIAYDVTRVHNLEQVRKNFVDNVSHELRTPLTVLSGYLETFLDQGNIPAGWERSFQQMQLQTKRMNALVNDLLLLANLENHQDTIYHQQIDMPELMNHLFDDAQIYNLDYGHSLNLEIDSHYDVMGSESAMTSAFINLITNAIKYTPTGGTITIGWHDHDDGAYFSVHDTGIGISAEHIPRLTERFYRVDTSRSRATGGTGLGLAIVKHALLQHHARLEIESEVGQGSIFKVIFPKHTLIANQDADAEWVDTT